ncbi:MAG: hypothetical protein ACI8RD_005140 [Bacillariaceae sp.]|jgi:hypothetical protein
MVEKRLVSKVALVVVVSSNQNKSLIAIIFVIKIYCIFTFNYCLGMKVYAGKQFLQQPLHSEK